MFTLLAYTLIDEVRNLSWIQPVLNLLILSVKAAKHAHTHTQTHKPLAVLEHMYLLDGFIHYLLTMCL